MKIDVYDLNSAKTGEIDLDDAVFGQPVREHLFWEVINWQRACRRQGTHNTKGRSEVRGGGRKPWRQKGTGRARQGSIRSPNWVGGGVVHGPKTRDYSYALPKKKRRAALISALSQKAEQGQLRVVDDLAFPEAKTKFALKVIGAFEARKALFVDVTQRDAETNVLAHNEPLRLSVRNLNNAKYLAAEGLNVEDLLHYDVLVMSRKAVEQVEEVLKR